MARAIGRSDEVVTLLTWMFVLSPLYIAGGIWMSALQATNIAKWNVARLLQPVLYLIGMVSLWLGGIFNLTSVVILFGVSLAVLSPPCLDRYTVMA
jgi:hypothetical protein